MDKIQWTRTFGLMLLGATGFWLPDVCLHAVRAYKFDSRDARIITVVMPFTLLGTLLAAKWAAKRMGLRRVGLPMLAGG